jgi:cholesterol transport system auxiliary component
LAACSIVAPAPAPLNVFDLGPATGEPPAVSSPIDLQITAAAELRTRDMLYRDAADSGRLSSYAESRWAAPPALMLERHLLLLMSPQSAGQAPAKRVGVQLLVFEQRFEQGRSQAVVVALATLAAGTRECARARFDVSEPAASADAPGGAQAFGRAARRLADELGVWIGANPECGAAEPAASKRPSR